jgi:hypothetical protein
MPSVPNTESTDKTEPGGSSRRWGAARWPGHRARTRRRPRGRPRGTTIPLARRSWPVRSRGVAGVQRRPWPQPYAAAYIVTAVLTSHRPITIESVDCDVIQATTRHHCTVLGHADRLRRKAETASARADEREWYWLISSVLDRRRVASLARDAASEIGRLRRRSRGLNSALMGCASMRGADYGQDTHYRGADACQHSRASRYGPRPDLSGTRPEHRMPRRNAG